MKRTLILLRHAKSSWADPTMRDFDRPLNDRGRRDAPFMANQMRKSIGTPDLVVSSDARRALTTAGVFAKEMGIEHISTEPSMYEAPMINLLKVVNSLDSTRKLVLLVGHNPGFSDLGSYLTGEQIALPTCSYVVIEFRNMEWSEVSGGTGELVSFDFPKNHS